MTNEEKMKKIGKEAVEILKSHGYPKPNNAEHLIEIVKEIESNETSPVVMKEMSIAISNLVTYYAYHSTNLDVFEDITNESFILLNESKNINLAPTLEWCLSLGICTGFLSYGDLAQLRLPRIEWQDFEYIKSKEFLLINNTIEGKRLLKNYTDFSFQWADKLLGLGRDYDYFNHNQFIHVKETQISLIRSCLIEHPSKDFYISSLIELIVVHLWLRKGFIIESITYKNDLIENCTLRYGNSSIEVVSFFKHLISTQISNENLSVIGIRRILHDAFEILPRIYIDDYNHQILGYIWEAIRSKTACYLHKISWYDTDEISNLSGIYPSEHNDIQMSKYRLFKELGLFS